MPLATMFALPAQYLDSGFCVARTARLRVFGTRTDGKGAQLVPNFALRLLLLALTTA
jgi:hypothetical protein